MHKGIFQTVLGRPEPGGEAASALLVRRASASPQALLPSPPGGTGLCEHPPLQEQPSAAHLSTPVI